MNNDPWRKRTPRSTLVAWLLERPELWEGYPKPIQPPGTRSHAQRIFDSMQFCGLFAPRSQCNQITITRLVEDAKLEKEIAAYKQWGGED